jgi:hypothetical protein
MYVDDSGSPSMKDNSDYYVISGVIIHETDIYPVEGATQTYKNRFEEFKRAEIHVHVYSRVKTSFRDLLSPENTKSWEPLGGSVLQATSSLNLDNFQCHPPCSLHLREGMWRFDLSNLLPLD